MNKKIFFTKLGEVKSPVRAFPTSAGIDFFMPKIDEGLIKDLLHKNPRPFGNIKQGVNPENNAVTYELIIYPGQRVIIPSRIKVWFMDDTPSALIAANKSGLASKKGIQFTAQVIDQEYSGEIHLGIMNTGDDLVSFKEGDKVIQFIHTPIFTSDLVELHNESYDWAVKEWESFFSLGETRGSNGFGSTDSK